VTFRSKPADIVPDPALETDPRWQLVQRIVASQHFLKSARLQEFLLYVCRSALEDRSSEISEQRIGERVFQRPPAYNPNEDNIVRSHARLLRQKLQAYFDSEGNTEPLILTIPKGGYSPEFVERAQPGALPATAGSPAHADERWGTPPVRGLLVVTGALVVAVVVLAWLLIESKQQRAQSVTFARPPALNALWSQFFGESVTTTVIIPDATAAMLQEATKQPIDLATYLRRSFNPENKKLREIESTLKGFSIRRYTTFDGVSAAVKIAQLADQFRGRVVVRYARDMTLRDFSPGNVVLIGRPSTNPWSEMFESKLNFRFYSDLQSDIPICRNRAPQPGEQAEYPPVEEGAKRTVYAAVAFVRNLNDGGNVLIIAGSSSGAQEIAAEFVTNEKLLNAFANRILKGRNRLPHFEILIRTITLAGVAQEPEIIAYRVLEP
jgi:hypothetical protein